jgi:hypothetical protein
MAAGLVTFSNAHNAKNGSHIDMTARLRQPLRTMTTSISTGSIRTPDLLRGLVFISFTGRYAYGRPEICR